MSESIIQNNMSSFLQETPYCNHNHEYIRELVSKISKSCDSQKEFAINSFYWIRDEIKYTVGLYPHTASETLENRHGSCTNKANLFVALLRANGIPSGFHMMRVDSRQYFGPICPPNIMRYMGSNSVHIYSGVQLENKWVKCDNTDDLALSLGACHLNPPAEPVDFDGVQDARLNINPDHVHSDNGEAYSTVDDFLQKSARIPEVIPAIFNSFGDFVRTEGRKIKSAREYHEAFFPWLQDINPALLKQFQMFEKETG